MQPGRFPTMTRPVTVAPAEGPAGLSVVEITATAPEDYLPRTGSLSVRSANGLSRKVSITQTGAEAPAGSEQAALIALYNSLGGPKWREQTNWLSNKPVGEWKGVRTDADGHVVSLYFYANNLIGWLPEQIGDFPYLEQLTFSHDPDIRLYSRLDRQTDAVADPRFHRQQTLRRDSERYHTPYRTAHPRAER